MHVVLQLRVMIFSKQLQEAQDARGFIRWFRLVAIDDFLIRQTHSLIQRYFSTNLRDFFAELRVYLTEKRFRLTVLQEVRVEPILNPLQSSPQKQTYNQIIIPFNHPP